MDEIEDRVKLIETNMNDYYSLESCCEDLEEKQDYLENMSRRNNIKILGITEDTEREKTWEDTEALVKKTVSGTASRRRRNPHRKSPPCGETPPIVCKEQ